MLDVPQEWLATGAELATGTWSRLVVLGARDRGKSTFCEFLLGHLAGAGRTVGLLDTDLGQKMLGPPACVTLGAAGDEGRLSLRRIRFVGGIDPAAGPAGAVVDAAARLGRSVRVTRLIVNTSGLVSGPGVALKRRKIDALRPERIVALEEGDELRLILERLPPALVRRLAPSPRAHRKSPAARAASRLASWRAALGGAAEHRLPALAVVEDLCRNPPAPGVARLCGLSDRRGEDLGVGLLRGREARSGPRVLSAVEPARVHRLRLGMAVPEAWLEAVP